MRCDVRCKAIGRRRPAGWALGVCAMVEVDRPLGKVNGRKCLPDRFARGSWSRTEGRKRRLLLSMIAANSAGASVSAALKIVTFLARKCNLIKSWLLLTLAVMGATERGAWLWSKLWSKFVQTATTNIVNCWWAINSVCIGGVSREIRWNTRIVNNEWFQKTRLYGSLQKSA